MHKEAETGLEEDNLPSGCMYRHFFKNRFHEPGFPSRVKDYFKKSTSISDGYQKGLGLPQDAVEWVWDHFTMLAKKMPQAQFIYSLEGRMS